MAVDLLHSPVIDLDPAREGAPAVGAGAGGLTYGELRRYALGVAGWLSDQGCRPGDRVAICLAKSPEAVALILGILTAGAAYVPLDPGAPPARLLRLLADARPRRFVTSPRIAEQLTTAGVTDVPITTIAEIGGGHGLQSLLGPAAGAGRPAIVHADDLAAILYTSGSSGEPKGVSLSHRNIRSFVRWAVGTFGCTASDRFASHAPFHFDLSTFDLFGAFAVGASVYVLSDTELKFPAAITRILERERITVWYSVPTALRRLVDSGGLDRRDVSALRLVLFAGEVFPLAGLRRLMSILPGAEHVNLYGPTETNVCTYYRLPAPPAPDATEIPIGVPCEHLEVTIVDPDGRPVAAGETGEICVAGPSVMRGYWGAEAATAATRVGGRADSFRTGDFGGWLADGAIRFLGRRDGRVKVRGHRIELLEIEGVLTAHPQVAEAAVVLDAPGEGEGELLAFVVPAGTTAPSDRSLAEHCAGLLPAYARPGRIVLVDDLPRTSTGKIDRQRLGQRGRDERRVRPASAADAPRTMKLRRILRRATAEPEMQPGPLPRMWVYRESDDPGPHFHPLGDPTWLPAADAGHMKPLDPVVGLVLDGRAWALPWWIMKNHHVANMTLGDRPVLVTFCEGCAASCAFTPVVGGQRLHLRLAGAYNHGQVLTDVETRSLWLPFPGEAVHGPLAGTRLPRLSSVYQCTWAEWRARFPGTFVPDGRGESRDGHGADFPSPLAPGVVFEFTRLRHDRRLPDAELVLGVEVGDAARAYPLATLHRIGCVLNDTIGGRSVVLLTRPSSWLTAAFSREIGGDCLEFVPGTDSDMEDTQTRTRWDLTGKALAGPLSGRQLEPVPSWIEKWYGWSAAHPATDILTR